MLAIWSPSAFGGYFVQIAVLWGHAGCPLSGVERCPLLGGSKCTISMGRAIGGMEFVRCTEVVRLSKSPLLEVSLYISSLVPRPSLPAFLHATLKSWERGPGDEASIYLSCTCTLYSKI